MRDTRRTRILLGLLLLAALTFVVIDLRGGEGGPLASLRSFAQTVFGPVESAASAVVRPVSDFFGGLGSIGDKDEQIARLEAENQRLRAELNTSAADRARAEQLDELLRVAGAGQYRTVPAQVIAVGPAQGFAWTVTIDAGRQDGLRTDMTVINGDGLVGRIADVGPSTATVVLLVDATTSIGARVAGSQEIGILSGTGRQDSMQMQLLDPLAPVESGDDLVTFGSQSGRPYAPGIPVGEVVEVSGTPGQLTRVATVRPFVNVSALDLVGVIIEPPREDPRDAVLPNPPTPSPTATATTTPTDEASTEPDGGTDSASPSPSPSPSG
jgi:rod shape-determining protein MreC